MTNSTEQQTGASPLQWEKLKPLARQMRHAPTEAEERLWQALRNRGVAGLKFRRQHAIERFIVDFFCLERRLIVEVDGPIHDHQQEYDAVRQSYLESLGLRVVRFTNEEVLHQMESVLGRIQAAAEHL
jgi:very-short-patch-repair endonuclease